MTPNKILAISLAYGHRGMPIGELPVGDSNDAIAALMARDWTRFYHTSVQHEIGTALRCNHGLVADFEVLEHRTVGEYLNTLENLEQIILNWTAEGINFESFEIWIYCHEDQALGIKAMMWRQKIVPTRFIVTNVYDPRSAQPWTQNKRAAMIEKIKRGLKHLLRGELDLRALISGKVFPR